MAALSNKKQVLCSPDFFPNCCLKVVYREEVSWLAIALTPQEAALLRVEPTFWEPQ